MQSPNQNPSATALPEHLSIQTHGLTLAEAVERQLRASIVDSSDDAILSKTLDGIITSWNRGAEQMYGYTADEIIGKHVSILAPPERQQEIDSIMERIRAGERVAHHETTRITKDGRRLEVSLSVSPLHDRDGRIIGASAIARNVDEQKRSQEMIAEWKNRYEATIQATGNVLFDWDSRTDHMIWAGNCRETLGYTPEELGDNLNQWRELIHPDDRPAFDFALEGLRTTKQSTRVQYRVRTKDGRYIWVQGNGRFMADADGNLVRMVGFISDITSQKVTEAERARLLAASEAAQAALQESERRLRVMTESSPAIMWKTSPQGEALYLNARWEEITGTPIPQALGHGWHDVVHPDDKARCAAAVQQAHTSGEPYQLEVRYRCRSGDYRWFLVRAVPLKDERGHILEWHGTSFDIHDRKVAEAERERLFAAAEAAQTALQQSEMRLRLINEQLEDRVRERTDELRRSEERYRELFENANDAVFTTDLEGRITSVNRAAQRITGYTREEFLRKNVTDVLVPEDHPRVFDRRKEKLQQGGITQYQVNVIAKDGRLIPAEISTRLIMENGRPVGIQGIARDITERKQTEDVLRQVSARLMELRDEERRRFARELHDSTGQNLAALMMNLSMVAANNGALDAQTHRTIKESLALADACAREIRTISYLLHPPLLDEMGLESALNWLADGFAERSGVAVDLKVSVGKERLPRDVELAVFRVVQESLTNIHRHSASRTAVIRVQRSDHAIELSVADHGNGIPGWKRDEPDWSRAGVGIAGMRERVALLGGKLQIESGTGGTTVSARLPLPKSAAAGAHS